MDPVAVCATGTVGGAHRPVVLVADDDPGVRMVLRVLLEDRFEVREAADGQEALDVLSGGGVDVLVLDMVMPRVDGWVVLGRLEVLAPGLPVVVVSSHVDPVDGRFRASRPPAAVVPKLDIEQVPDVVAGLV